MRSIRDLVRENSSISKGKWPNKMNRQEVQRLRGLTQQYKFSVAADDLLLLENGWYVTHTGLIRLATRRHCSGIEVRAISEFSDALNRRYAFKATVYKSRQSSGFVGYGDADPSNVSLMVRGAEMRVAETRAVNRALRKVYGLGICSVEEIGSLERHSDASPDSKKIPQPANGNGNGNRSVRDRLCQVIRQHQLDPNLVKSYAIDFCGVKNLRDATREQVENFIVQLADWAEKDRSALLCQLNSYLPQKEGAA